MDYKAKIKDGVLQIFPVVEKVGNDVIVHVPNFQTMETLRKEVMDKLNRGELVDVEVAKKK